MNDSEKRRAKLCDWISENSLHPEPYLFLGTAHPERALLNIPEFSFRGAHSVSGFPIAVLASIINGRIAVHLYTDGRCDPAHLKSYAHGAIEGQVAIATLILGYVFAIEITQVINLSLGINWVYAAPGDGKGIDIQGDQQNAFDEIRKFTTGRSGAFVTRCLIDMSTALDRLGDAAFYCYRAIESLNQHCIETHSLSDRPEAAQWQDFRRRAKCSKEHLMAIKHDADPIRHGNHLTVGKLSPETVIDMTRKVVASYLGISLGALGGSETI